jgi:hypothetical protein
MCIEKKEKNTNENEEEPSNSIYSGYHCSKPA